MPLTTYSSIHKTSTAHSMFCTVLFISQPPVRQASRRPVNTQERPSRAVPPPRITQRTVPRSHARQGADPSRHAL